MWLALSERGLADDPSRVLSVDPVFEWARSVWQRFPPIENLQGAIEKQTARLQFKTRPWGSVTGPAGAFIMTAFRLGWTILFALEVVTEKGHLVEFRRYSTTSLQPSVGKCAQFLGEANGPKKGFLKPASRQMTFALCAGKRGPSTTAIVVVQQPRA